MDYKINSNIMKIIEALKEGSLYFTQLVEKTGIKSKNNLVKNLNFLVKLNILKRDENKSNTYYRLNYNDCVLLSLLNTVNMINFQHLPIERRKPVEEIIRLVKPVIAILFGSTAKGNFKKDSDIDLLLVMEKTRELSKEAKEISSRYNAGVNAVVISIEEFEKGNDTISHIIKTGYPVSGYNYFYEKYKL